MIPQVGFASVDCIPPADLWVDPEVPQMPTPHESDSSSPKSVQLFRIHLYSDNEYYVKYNVKTEDVLRRLSQNNFSLPPCPHPPKADRFLEKPHTPGCQVGLGLAIGHLTKRAHAGQCASLVSRHQISKIHNVCCAHIRFHAAYDISHQEIIQRRWHRRILSIISFVAPYRVGRRSRRGCGHAVDPHQGYSARRSKSE